MRTNELLVNTIIKMAKEAVLRGQELDASERKVVDLADNNEAEYILNSQIENENDGLKEDIACLRVDLDEAKKENESFGLTIQKLLTLQKKKK